MIVLGCDPGVNGAFALIADGIPVLVLDLPTTVVVKSDKKRCELDTYEFARLIDAAGHIDHAFIERVGAMPTDGAIQAFAFGQVFGAIRGVLAAHFIPQTLVSPVTWRNALIIAAGFMLTVNVYRG
ncbi:MAG: hypothetical protein IPK75_20150 [Acidobacteria bacterium]|nr:hypothetical protein [Acidobacteriota bacterium]